MTSAADSPTSRQKWEERYGGTDDFIYGTEPNDFLRDAATGIPSGDVLCIADGEGRNGVYLATLGHRVTSVDLAQAGMKKAHKLAESRGVEIVTHAADLADFDFGESGWDMIVSIWAHTPPDVRRRIHAAVAGALRPGGHFILEAYTPDQIGRGPDGPKTPEIAMTLAGLRSELAGVEIEHGLEIVRTIDEGRGHSGEGAVVQIIAHRAHRDTKEGPT
jgi:SAM-dependent methyltransferase